MAVAAIVAIAVIAFVLSNLNSAPSWCQDCAQASHDEWEAGQMGYNSASYSSFCNRHRKMPFPGLDPRPRS